jgi:hypothetical protein
MWWYMRRDSNIRFKDCFVKMRFLCRRKALGLPQVLFLFVAAGTIACAPASSAQSAEDDVPMIECKWASKSPDVDGRLDDLCWKEANYVTGFTRQTIGGSPAYQTTALVVYDEENLYVAFICYDNMKHLSKDVHLDRDGEVWLDDCVEVFMDVDHDHKDYFHVISNRSGVRFDEIGRWKPKSWDSDWKVGVAFGKDFWTVEMTIPFQDVRTTPESKRNPTPIPGETWGINFCRANHRIPEKSSWTLTQNTFHDPIHFGHIVFLPFL